MIGIQLLILSTGEKEVQSGTGQHTKEQESDQMDENLGLQSLQPYGPIDNGFSFSLETCVY